MNEKIKMEDFGFFEPENEIDITARGEDDLLRIFYDNPDMFNDIFIASLRSGNLNAPAVYDFFEQNPDYTLKLAINGKDIDKLIADFKSAIDKIHQN